MNRKPASNPEAGRSPQPARHADFRSAADGLCNFAIPLLVTLCLESALIYSWQKGFTGLAGMAAGHLVCMIFLGLWTWGRYRAQPSDRFSILLFLFTATMGPFGAAGVGFTAGMHLWFRRSAIPFSEWYESLFPSQETHPAEQLYNHLKSRSLLEIDQVPLTSFMDVLQKGNAKEKQALVVLLVNNYHGKFGSVLKAALNDEDNSVRVLAAQGLAKIEEKYSKKRQTLENFKEHPDRPSVEHLKTLAKHYDEYIYSGILDEVRETNYRERAIRLCKTYLRHHPDDPELHLAVGRLFVRGGKHETAASWFENSIQMGVKTPSLLVWYLECLFNLGQFEKLRQQAARHFAEIESVQDQFRANVFHTLKFWAQAGGSEKPGLDTSPVTLGG